MSFPFTVYNPGSGRVYWTGSCEEKSDAMAQVGPEGSIVLLVSADNATQYIVNAPGISNPVVDRPLPAIDRTTVPADGATPVTLSNLADPCTVKVDGVPRTVTGGSETVTFAVAGDYLIEILESFPHQALTVTVTAT